MSNYNRILGEEITMRRIYKETFMLVMILLLFIFTSTFAYADTSKNVTTTVNITNAGPEILAMQIENPVVLNAGGIKILYCNATVRDYNGVSDLNVINATFHYYLNLSSQPDDLNEHYTNTNCTQVSEDGLFTANYSCNFSVSYIAFNGTWFCNVSVNDTRAYTATAARATNISALYALNVTDIINYGNLSVTDYSSNITAVVTNFGNVNINVSVLGYGETQGDGIGLVCTQGTNISVQYQRFSSSVSADWATKIALGITNKDMNVTLARQTNDAVPVTANTYWQLYVPPNPFGVCTGTVRFTATAP